MSEAVAALLDTASSLHGSIDILTYEQGYDGNTYSKRAYVYVPASYSPNHPANVLYLTHGWWGNAAGLADGVAPVVDELEKSGEVAPTIVVFATYYPDRSFATDDYEDDYVLNRFFATSEIDTLIEGRLKRTTRPSRTVICLTPRFEPRAGTARSAVFRWVRRPRGTCSPCARSTSTGTCRWRASRGLDARRMPTRRASRSW